MKPTAKKTYLWLLLGLFLFSSATLLPAKNDKKTKKIQIDLYGGFALVNPSEFNRIPQTESAVREFMYDRYLNYRLNHHEILNWSNPVSGKYGEIKYGFPAGIRLKYALNPTFSLTLGLKTILAPRYSNPSFNYQLNYSQYESYRFETNYSSYQMTASGLAPLLGLSYGKELSQRMELSAFVAGGPLFGRIQQSAQWEMKMSYYSQWDVYPMHQEINATKMSGTGVGLALEGGLNLSYRLGKHLALFFEGVYAYQKVSSLSGEGWSEYGDARVTWEGEWAMKQETIHSIYYGDLNILYPTNHWQSNETPAADFKLDLSGFECRLGLSYRF